MLESAGGTPHEVGSSRRDDTPAFSGRGSETIVAHKEPPVAPLNAARTAQRAVPYRRLVGPH